MKKERLTADNIERDLMTQIDHEHRSSSGRSLDILLRYNANLTLIAWILAIALICLKHYAIGALLIAVGLVILSIGLVPIIVKHYRTQKARAVKQEKIKRREYRIVGDTLSRARQDALFGEAYGSDLLEFARYGSYVIPRGTSYAWSKDCYMSADGVFNTSIEGDRFYLVLVKNEHDKERIAAVYNAKLFEIDDDPFDYFDREDHDGGHI